MHGGSNLDLSLTQSKLVALNSSYVYCRKDDVEAVNKLNRNENDNIENVDNDVILWSVEQETGRFDQRSSDDESQGAIDMKLTEICEVKCESVTRPV